MRKSVKFIVYLFAIFASFIISVPSAHALDTNSHFQVKNCTCASSGNAGDKTNKINCPAPANWDQRNKAGDPNYPQPWNNYSFFCSNGWPCTNGGRATGSDFATYDNGNTGFGSHVYAGTFELNGVSCHKPIVDCTCNDPNSGGPSSGGDNSFTCRERGAPNVTGTGACGTDPLTLVPTLGGVSCINVKGYNATGHEFTVDHTGILNDDVDFYGIKCRQLPIPPPPSPPCVTWNNGQCSSVGTALGKLSTSTSGFVRSLFAVLLSISGGIALLLIIKAGYQLMTAQGKPEQLQNGRDQLIAAIVGLIFLIFSFVFLQLIGFDILHIPGFGQ